MDKPFISVIVASYNYEAYIRETLDSLVSQDYEKFEVVIVDDGSKDNSCEIIREYVGKYTNFYFYQHKNGENKGLAETVKLALSKAKGDYVAFCESDDYWSSDHLSELASYVKKHPDVAVIVNDFELVGTAYESKSYAKNIARLRKYDGKRNFHLFWRSNNIPTFSATAVKRNVLSACDFSSPERAWLDFWLWRQIARDYKIGLIDKKLTYFRRHDDSYIQRTGLDVDKHCDFIRASNRLIFSNNPFRRLWMNWRIEFFRLKKHLGC